MTVSGFTCCRNAVKYDYPLVESIKSALPLCDEFIVNVGRCEDGTLELVQSIELPVDGSANIDQNRRIGMG